MSLAESAMFSPNYTTMVLKKPPGGGFKEHMKLISASREDEQPYQHDRAGSRA